MKKGVILGFVLVIVFGAFAGAEVCNIDADIMLVIDASETMATPWYNPPLSNAKNAMNTFVNLLNPSYHKAGLVTFRTGATLDRALTTDYSAVHNKINGIQASGLTGMSSGIKKAREQLDSDNGRPGVSKAIIILSDGKPNTMTDGDICWFNTERCENDAINWANLAKHSNPNTVIYVIGHRIGPAETERRDFLKQIATSDNHYYDYWATDQESVLTEIFEQISLDICPCGNGIVDGNEQCDNSATNPLDGNTCLDVSSSYCGGTLACTDSCTFNTASCTACQSTSQCVDVDRRDSPSGPIRDEIKEGSYVYKGTTSYAYDVCDTADSTKLREAYCSGDSPAGDPILTGPGDCGVFYSTLGKTWGCVDPDGPLWPPARCECIPDTQDNQEFCNGEDDNCNDVVDDEAICNDEFSCVNGACVCPVNPAYTCNDYYADNKKCGMLDNGCGVTLDCTTCYGAGETCDLDLGVCVSSGGTVCGDGEVEPGEECEPGVSFTETCVNQGYAGGGVLGCYPVGNANECKFDTTGCIGSCSNACPSTGLHCRVVNGLDRLANCGNYDADSCLEWENSGTLCPNGCVVNPDGPDSCASQQSCGNGEIESGEECETGANGIWTVPNDFGIYGDGVNKCDEYDPDTYESGNLVCDQATCQIETTSCNDITEPPTCPEPFEYDAVVCSDIEEGFGGFSEEDTCNCAASQIGLDCTWDPASTTCGSTNPFGSQCVYTFLSQTDCSGEETRTIDYEWRESGVWSDECALADPYCDVNTNSCSYETFCQSPVKLPFFTFANVIATVLIVVLVYLVWGEMKRKRK